MKNKFTLSFALLLFVFSAAKLNAQTAKIQIVHNSPDYIIDTVDVWCDTVKIANDLVFHKATQLITVDSGYHVITISKKISTDSSALYSLLKVDSFRVDTSQTYLAFITGVVDTNTYAPNPSGIDRSLSFVAIDSYKTTGLATQVDLSFFNGTPDAPQWDLNEIGLPGLTKIADDVAYNSFAPATLMPGVNTMFNITSADSSSIMAAYRLNMLVAGFKGNTACIFSSGVLPSASNPTLAAANNFYVVLNNGSVVPLITLMGDVQFVHNSADVTNDSLDIYINGTLVWDNFAFRSASPFMNYKAYTAFNIAIAPQTSVSVADAFYTTNMTLDSNVSYYLIAHGVKVASSYVANPNGKNIDFKVTSYKGARKIASAPKNVDLLYFHGTTDLQTTTCRGDAQSQFLSKDDSYGAFHGYGAHTSLDNITMQLKDAVADTVIYTGTADLAAYQGKTGLVFTSGFLHSNATTNQNGDTLIMFVAWNDGNVDSIAVKAPATGISERVLAQSMVSVFPNPANNQFTVQLTTQKSSEVSFTVTDITGRTIVADTSAKLSSGTNIITVDATTFASGIYFVTLRSNGDTITQKISIAK
jgi:hypothetical protein